MCSLILSFEPAARWPVIIAANRDEMLDRAWDAPGRHWPGIIGGRDRIAGGTWLALNDHGVIAALLNRTGSLGPAPGKASRGELPLIALQAATAATASARIAALDARRYRSFNMVIADAGGAFLIRGLETGTPEITAASPGITMVTASDPNDLASPRIARYLKLFDRTARPDPDTADWSAWTTLLADRTPPTETALNVTPRQGFGTICASLLALAPSLRARKPARAQFHFAAGPPDTTRFAPLVTACSDASPASASSP